MTRLIVLFFATYSAAFMATVPPGLLNMNAAKTSVDKGKLNGIIFSLGVATVIMIQAYIGVLISKFLYNNPEVIDLLLKLAIAVFAFFAVYFYLAARKHKTKKIRMVKVSKRNSYFKGMLLATLNLLTIPYYAGLNAMWNASGLLNFEQWEVLTFIFAAGCGSFTVLYLYTVYFNKLESRTDTFSKNSNYILSLLMLILLAITTIRIFYRQ